MTLGNALKLYRLKNNLLQKQMAYLLGISKEYYCKIENDKIIPGRKLIQKQDSQSFDGAINITPSLNISLTLSPSTESA